MAFTVQLIEGSEPAIDLFYSVTDAWAMLEKGFMPNDPERREIWGGHLEDQLVRQEYGKRVIPLKLQGKWGSPDALIDAVNALEERLAHAARFRKDGWGDEVFLKFQLHDSNYAVQYPVCSGSIDKGDLMNACASIMTGGHRVTKFLVEVPVTLVCEPYWEADTTYSLENYVYNPGWWRGAAPGDSWTEDNGADVTSTIDTTIYEVMGQSLKQVYVVDAVNDTGVQGDAITVTASTDYYFEARCYRATGCDTLTAQVYDASNAAVIAASVLTFDGAVDVWVKDGVTFETPVGCLSVQVQLFCLAASSTAGGTAYWDAVYVGTGATAPVGWSSGRNLVNCLDATADNINVLCVTEIPGEVEAEVRIPMHLTSQITNVWCSKRTRDNPHNFIWELLGASAVVTAGDAACLDSVLAPDANAPGGQRVVVNFAGTQTMALRCYWDISTNLTSYYGRWQLILLVSKSANTDDVNMRVKAENSFGAFYEGYSEVIQEANQAAANQWLPLAGWTVFSFPIGIHDDDLWAAGDFWRFNIYASITGAAAWDNLWIAGAYLMPLDEGAMVSGAPFYAFAAGTDITIDNEGRNRGVFGYRAAIPSYRNNIGYVGQLPTLTPKVENWLYFILGQTVVTGDILITDPAVVSLTYRPRGIFLRGSNPG